MKRVLLGALCCTTSAVADPLPKGWASFHDLHLQAQPASGETWLVLRYLSPNVARDTGIWGYEEVAPALDQLCDDDGVDAANLAIEQGGTIDQIVVTVMDRVVDWGTADPEATMYRGAYSLKDGRCEWQ